jgi:hypothetical protein
VVVAVKNASSTAGHSSEAKRGAAWSYATHNQDMVFPANQLHPQWRQCLLDEDDLLIDALEINYEMVSHKK